MTDTAQQFDRFLESHEATLRQAIRKTCPRDLDGLVADIEQEARLRLWKAILTHRSIRDPRSYVYTVGVNATLDAVRRSRARSETMIDPHLDSDASPIDTDGWRPGRVANPETTARRRELLATLEDCLARLAKNRQLAVRLYLQGFTVVEAANLLGWSRAKARHLTYRGRDELRRYLRAGGIDYEAQH